MGIRLNEHIYYPLDSSLLRGATVHTASTYDDLDRPETVTTPAGAVTTTTYNALTVTTSVDPDGAGPRPAQTKKTVKNPQGQVASIRTNEGSAEPNVDTTMSYTYDPFGNLLTTTDASGNVTTLSYDIRGRKTQMLDPDMGRWTYNYNVLSELKWQCDPVSRGINPPECTGSATTMTYDKLGRMTNRTERDLISEWTWDTAISGYGKGKLASVSSSNGYSRSHAYDNFARPSSNTVTIGTENFTTNFSYNSWSRVRQITYPANPFTGTFVVEHTYRTWSGLPWDVRNVSGGENALLWRADSVSPSGKVLTETLGNNLTVARTFDSGDRLWTVQTSGVQNDTYTSSENPWCPGRRHLPR